MDHKTSYKLLHAGLLGGAVILFVGLYLQYFVAFYIGVGIMLAATFQAWAFWRCPFCGKRLNVRGRRPTYCPNCSRDLGFDKGKDHDDHR